MNIKCTLTDAQLIDEAQRWISTLLATGGRAWSLSVPAKPNQDPDFIFTELCERLKIKEPTQ